MLVLPSSAGACSVLGTVSGAEDTRLKHRSLLAQDTEHDSHKHVERELWFWGLGSLDSGTCPSWGLRMVTNGLHKKVA